MKKVKRIYYCDKCGALIKQNEEHPIVLFPSGRHSTCRTLHLCPTCQRIIEQSLNYYNEFKEEEIWDTTQK